jgi:uncharacterized coiled-coil protein SlyX
LKGGITMAERIMELEKQIAEKNKVLDSLDKNKQENRDKIYLIKSELDKLLFAYYKALKCKYNSTLCVLL